ncbi:hypothetical protein SAMD00019534_072840 [Acytostelium subglobosum LB1]|uniref:hypothetical protein n=1 Tax=Acytostelium subglobosum LB1 TaxID=1410327 RepID=UPI000644A6CE|nr:hypothetical protein SAMD00019534_072840 [Acytostelium subglobosum LB1]GAM24109.1 hypothetical protein SAMD00019534_072840 [Acytostelium subglobosum LB1]|eukprot:XP_012753145.1 hypothetical protein SAMD00019534_072840 [Acytostelium subglobosum LB1]
MSTASNVDDRPVGGGSAGSTQQPQPQQQAQPQQQQPQQQGRQQQQHKAKQYTPRKSSNNQGNTNKYSKKTSSSPAASTSASPSTSTTPQPQQAQQQQQQHTPDSSATTSTSTSTSSDSSNTNDSIGSTRSTVGRPCVVGVIGDSSRGKFFFLNKMVNDSVFHSLNLHVESGNVAPDDTIKLEIYNDVDKDNVYINLNSIRDTKTLVNAWHSLEINQSSDIEKWLEDEDFVYMKYMLYMFQVCNIIFLVFENLTIKMEYFTMFRLLRQLKQSSASAINNIVAKQNIPADVQPFLTPGKCVPILQVFLIKDLSDNYTREFHLKLEESLKKQLLLIMKNNDLFTSFNHYLNSKQPSNPPLFLIELGRPLVRLIRLYQTHSNSGSASIGNANEAIDRTKPNAGSTQRQFRFFKQLLGVYESGHHNIPTACINGYKQSLVNLKYELPEYAVWERTAKALQTLFDQKDSAFSNIKNSINMDTQFSSKNCQIYYKSALDQYLDGLPQVYGAKLHHTKLQKAIKTLTFYAAGPSLDQSVQNLINECDAVWKKGRKLCEAESITGRLCSLKTHPLPSKEPGAVQDPEAKYHSTNFRTRGSCNCGKSTRFPREDVFDVDYANSEFYHADCCAALQTLELPPTKVLMYSGTTATTPRKELTPPVSWFTLLKHGRSLMYVPQEGMPNDSFFVNNEALLQEWDFNRIMNTFNSFVTGTNDQVGASTSSSTPRYESGRIAFEYQCPLGHRFYEKRRSKIFFINSSSTKSEFRIFYQRQILENCTSSDCDFYAQLIRIVMMPTMDITMKASIEITQNNDKSNRWEFQLDPTANIILAKDQLYTFRLPYAYVLDSLNVLRSFNNGVLSLHFGIKSPNIQQQS